MALIVILACSSRLVVRAATTSTIAYFWSLRVLSKLAQKFRRTEDLKGFIRTFAYLRCFAEPIECGTRVSQVEPGAFSPADQVVPRSSLITANRTVKCEALAATPRGFSKALRGMQSSKGVMKCVA